MKNTKLKPSCSCGSTLHLSVRVKYKRKDGTTNTLYRCRKCNTARMQKYWSTEQGRETAKKSNKRSYYKYRSKAMARNLFNYHVRKGHIKKIPCRCGNEKVEGHHKDYSKPLKVVWLCRSCHTKIHEKLRTY